jgi:hypothetical protein
MLGSSKIPLEIESITPIRDQWETLAKEPLPNVCVELTKLVYEDRDGNRTCEIQKIIVAGSLDEVVSNVKNMAQECEKSNLARLCVPEVLRMSGFGEKRFSSNALTNLLCCIGMPDKASFYVDVLEKRRLADPVANNVMDIFNKANIGGKISLEEINYLQQALKNQIVLRLCVENGLKLQECADLMCEHEDKTSDAILTRLTQKLFKIDSRLDGYPVVEFHNMDALHQAIRSATGVNTLAGRPLINHSSGGCAAFAVVLNKVLDGPGIYVLNEDTRNDVANHVALRVGNFICDGEGVHSADDFLRNWSTSGGLSEVLDSSLNGDWVRRYGAKEQVFGEIEVESYLIETLGLNKTADISGPKR